MARKFIISENQLIMGNVGFHFELARDRKNVVGGGYWFRDNKRNLVFLYGKSIDFGSVTIEEVKKALEVGLVSPFLEDFSFYFSNHDDLELVELDFKEGKLEEMKPSK